MHRPCSGTVGTSKSHSAASAYQARLKHIAAFASIAKIDARRPPYSDIDTNTSFSLPATHPERHGLEREQGIWSTRWGRAFRS
jgi:hypothetical protein